MSELNQWNKPDLQAFFSDTTADYVQPPEPDLYKRVTIRLRTGKGQAQSCFLVLHRNRGVRPFPFPYLRMSLRETDTCFDYYEVTFEVTESPLRYYFEIAAGGAMYRYTRRGVRNTIRPADWWHILPGFHPPAWAGGAVMYQIFVDRFCNGDKTNDVYTGEYRYYGRRVIRRQDWDAPPTGASYREFYGGDLRGVIDKLDYLQDLGVEAIYLNPIFLSPSSHKYDTQDYEHIDPHFGRIVRDLPEMKGKRGKKPANPAGPVRAVPCKAGGSDSVSVSGSGSSRAVSDKAGGSGRAVSGKAGGSDSVSVSGRAVSDKAGGSGRAVSGRAGGRDRASQANRKAERYILRVTDPENLKASDRLFALLVRQAHARGIRVILDGVFNHCGSFHRWMDVEKIYEQLPGEKKGAKASRRSPYAGFFHFRRDAWPENSSYECWWNVKTLPKLNYDHSEELCEYILQIARKWVSPPYNADGWRLDVAADLGYSPEFNHQFWKRFRTAVREANPDAIVLAENYMDSWKWLQGGEWDTIMNYEYFMEPVTAFFTGMEKHSDARLEEFYGDPDAFWDSMLHKRQAFVPDAALRIAMNELSNHDHSRFLTRTNRVVGRVEDLGPDAADRGVRTQVMRQAVLLQMTWPGAPTIYYGDEAGVTGFTDPDNRRTYPWGHEDRKLLLYHRVLISLRRASRALRLGSILRLHDTDGVLAYARFCRGTGENGSGGSPSESYIILINLNTIPVEYEENVTYAGIPPEARLTCLIRTDRNGFMETLSTHPVCGGILRITLPPESGFLLRWK